MPAPKLSPEEAQRLGMMAEMGYAQPADVRLLLRHICQQIADGRSLDLWTLRYLKSSLQQFLDGKHSIAAALGLVRKRRGRKTLSESQGAKVRWIAADVLQQMLDGKSLETAAALVGDKYGRSETQVREYWRKNKADAILYLSILRRDREYPWSSGDIRQIRRIYRKNIRTGDDERDLRENRWLVFHPESSDVTPVNSKKKPA